MTRPKKLPPGIRHLDSGRYQARYPVTEHGVTRQVTAGTFASIADAKDARNAAMVAYKNGTWIDPKNKKVTVEQWSKEWELLRRGVNTKDASFLRSRIVPWWGERKLREITSLDVQRWINLLQDDGLAPATVRTLHFTFKKMMTAAVDHDLLIKSPCRNIILPAEVRTEPVKLSVDQLLLLEQKAPERFRAMVHLSAWAGLRWGEVAALRWEDVDLETGLILVRQAIKVDGKIGVPKNGKERVVPIGETTVEVLRTHRRDFGQHSLLFVGPQSGGALNGGNFRKAVWAPLVTRCELDPVPTWHDLRHAHAAHMVRMGMDWIVLSARLGHHKPSFTADRYGWVRQDFAEVSVAAIDAAMRGE